MMRTIFSLALVIVCWLDNGAAGGQESPKTPLIGYLVAGGSRAGEPNRGALIQGLEELGYVVGKNIRIEVRVAGGNLDLLPKLAAELVSLNPAVIVPSGPSAGGPVLKVTKTIPVVMPNLGYDPIGWGFVKSLAQPGGNATGITIGIKGLGTKTMELLKEALPLTRRVVFLNPHRGPTTYLEEYKDVARALGIEVESVNIRSDEDIEQFFANVDAKRPDALIVERNTLTLRNAGKIGELALKNRLPTMNGDRILVEMGGLLSYGINYNANFRRAAVFVDKILKGASPATLPVEPPHLEFVINLQTAQKIGVKIPPEILLEANEVIK